jgi:hypothetical protein
MSYSETCFDPTRILFRPWEACCLCWNFNKWNCVVWQHSNLAARCGHLKNEGVGRPQTSGLRHHVRSWLCLFTDLPEDGGSILLQNASSVTIHIMSNPRREESLPALLWESQISCDFLYLMMRHDLVRPIRDIKCALFYFFGFRVENILGKMFGKCIHFLYLGYHGHHNRKINYDSMVQLFTVLLCVTQM